MPPTDTPEPPDLHSVAADLARVLTDPDRSALERALATGRFGDPAGAAARMLEGELARRGGQAARAASLLEAALRALPDVLPAWHCAALARLAAGSRAGARALWRALLERAPDDRIARYQIGLTLHDDGALEQALQWYEQQVARHPGTVQAWHNIGACAQDLGQMLRAAAAFRQALALDPRRTASWMGLGGALRASGDNRGAAAAWREAHRLNPTDPRPLALAAAALGAEAELPQAIDCLERAIALSPHDAELRIHVASHQSNLGLHDAALAQFRAAAELAPQSGAYGSLVLLEMQYEDRFASRDELARAHWAWGDRYTANVAPMPVARSRSAPGARLRIGYVSPRFSSGPLANLFLPLLRAHDRRRFHVTLYCAYEHGDDVAQTMRRLCDAWRTLPEDDDAAAAMIAADRLDLLVDLAGHAPGHRLLALARKPAPVQATWLDYFETTGVAAIDYLVSDRVHTPVHDAPHFRERIAYLPACRFVYAPFVAPRRTEAPSLRSGFVTFGSFNRHAKVTADTLALWGEALQLLPGSRLRLRASAYRGAGTVAFVRERWASLGLPADRIDFLPYVPLEQAILDYANVDVALDTFPYNGGITTCDALSMGVPVVTIPGERMIARQSASLLRAAGRPGWIARDRGDFLRIVEELAHPSRLAGERDALLRDFPRSSLCDVDGFVAAFERLCVRLVDAGPLDRTQPVPPPLALD